MRVDDNFSASTDIRSLQLDRSQEIQQVEQEGRERDKDRSGDRVALSSLSRHVSRALSLEWPTQIARVDAAKEAVSAGRYEANAMETADAMVSSALTETTAQRSVSVQQRPPSPF